MVAISGICTFSSSPIMDPTVMPQHIGIVGCSAEGAALCYRTICVEGAAILGGTAIPRSRCTRLPSPSTRPASNATTGKGVGELMLASAEKLATIGADFLICPDNTIHQAWPYVEPRRHCPGCTSPRSSPTRLWRADSVASA